MKKLFSVILAIAMIASIAPVAFAATEVAGGYTDGVSSFESAVNVKDTKNVVEYLGFSTRGDAPTVAKEKDNGKYSYPLVGLYGPFSYDNDDKALYTTKAYFTNTDVDGENGNDECVTGPIEFGSTAFYALIQFIPDSTALNDGDDIEGEDGRFTLVKNSDTVSSLKIKQEWEEGDDFVKSISIVKKKVMNGETTYAVESSHVDDSDDPDEFYPTAVDLGLDKFGYEEDGYYYFLTISLEKSTSTSDADIIGTLELNKSKDPSVDEMEFDIGFNLDWENSWRQTAAKEEEDCKVTGDREFKAETNYALKFDCDDEVEFTFDDDSTFNVDVSGQGKLLFNYNTDYVGKIANKYARMGAELMFWNGNGAKFNRVGEFFLSCEDMEGNLFLYQANSDGSLSEVPGAEWDDSDEGFYFKTRTLGTFVVSDMELIEDEPVVSAPSASAPVVSTPVITNPSTGAAA